MRVICEKCKEAYSAPLEHLVSVGVDSQALRSMVRGKAVTLKRGKGCEKCNSSGYKGRVGLYEVMEITEEMRELILVGASALELRKKAVEEGMITLRRSGLTKVMEGVTTIEEVARETVK